MRAFNLDDAKAGMPVCTRSGQKARIICYNRKAYIYSIVALVMDDEGYESVVQYYENGRRWGDEVDLLDLMMVD